MYSPVKSLNHRRLLMRVPNSNAHKTRARAKCAIAFDFEDIDPVQNNQTEEKQKQLQILRLRCAPLSDCLFCQEVESNWEAGIEFFQAWAIYPSDVMAGSEPEDSLPGAHRLG
jgi:hypothetical protein